MTEDFKYTLYASDCLASGYFTVLISYSKETIDKEYSKYIKNHPTWHIKVTQEIKIKEYIPKELKMKECYIIVKNNSNTIEHASNSADTASIFMWGKSTKDYTTYKAVRLDDAEDITNIRNKLERA